MAALVPGIAVQVSRPDVLRDLRVTQSSSVVLSRDERNGRHAVSY